MLTNRLLPQIAKMAGQHVHRITMFKLPNEEDQRKMKETYENMLKNVPKKDGEPYVVSLVAGAANKDDRAQGYTFVAKSEFASVEDHRFYDEECEAHKALKAEALKLQHAGPPLTVFLTPGIVSGKPEGSE